MATSSITGDPMTKSAKEREKDKTVATNAVRTDRVRAKFLDGLREGYSKQAIARSLGHARSTFSKWEREDPIFKQEAWQEGRDLNADLLENVLLDHALNGVPEPIVHEGRIQMVYARNEEGEILRDEHGAALRVPVAIRKYDHNLGMKLLEGNRPEVYGKKVALTGANGKDLIPREPMTLKELGERAAELGLPMQRLLIEP